MQAGEGGFVEQCESPKSVVGDTPGLRGEELSKTGGCGIGRADCEGRVRWRKPEGNHV
jgi:hypothetical protein